MAGFIAEPYESIREPDVVIAIAGESRVKLYLSLFTLEDMSQTVMRQQRRTGQICSISIRPSKLSSYRRVRWFRIACGN